MLWGFAGILSFGQAAFFAHRRLRLAADLDRLRVYAGVAAARSLAAAVALAPAVASLVGWLAFGHARLAALRFR